MPTHRLPNMFRVAAVSLLALLPVLTPLTAVRAETISVVPPKFELLGNPGDILNEEIKVGNSDASQVTYQTSVQDFNASGDTGGVSFVEDPNAPTTTYALAKWVTIEPSRLTVDANSQKTVSVTIRIPKNAEPGSHFASVQVALTPTASTVGGTATVSSKLNTLILLRVSGNTTEKLSVDYFRPVDSYNQKGPIDFDLRTTNGGNVHVAPAGTITITDMFNKKVAEIPLTSANVLPGGSRQIHTVWDSGNKIGRFTANLVATYGDSKQPIAVSTTFYIIPVPLLVGILALVLIIIFLITKRKKVRKFLNKLTSD